MKKTIELLKKRDFSNYRKNSYKRLNGIYAVIARSNRKNSMYSR